MALGGLLTSPAGGLETFFEARATLTEEFILPIVFVLLGNPVFNTMSQVWEEFLGAF